MVSPPGILTTGIRLKTATLAVVIVFSSIEGVSGFDITPIPATKPPLAVLIMTPLNMANTSPDTALWDYLRKGLNYLEASGKEVPTGFIHPGGVAFGPLALTRIAVKDVLLRVPSMAGYTINDVLADKTLYEKCARHYADLLLRHYLKLDLESLSREEIFTILQKAWFLGPTIYKNCTNIPWSREQRAIEYMCAK